jgi:asparagine N-glycosylation enzyme membrane subunit Stt3
MPIFDILIVLIVLGLVYWLITTLPIAEPFKTIIYVVLVLCLILWLLSLIGVGPSIRFR